MLYVSDTTMEFRTETLDQSTNDNQTVYSCLRGWRQNILISIVSSRSHDNNRIRVYIVFQPTHADGVTINHPKSRRCEFNDSASRQGSYLEQSVRVQKQSIKLSCCARRLQTSKRHIHIGAWNLSGTTVCLEQEPNRPRDLATRYHHRSGERGDEEISVRDVVGSEYREHCTKVQAAYDGWLRQRSRHQRYSSRDAVGIQI